MRTLAVGFMVLMLAACGPKDDNRACCAIPPDKMPPVSSPAPAPSAADPGAFVPPPAGDPALASACTNGLKARGLQPNELMLMAHTPDGICPNNGVSEARIREILDKDWEAARCRQYSKTEMLNALTTGACGGDAG